MTILVHTLDPHPEIQAALQELGPKKVNSVMVRPAVTQMALRVTKQAKKKDFRFIDRTGKARKTIKSRIKKKSKFGPARLVSIGSKDVIYGFYLASGTTVRGKPHAKARTPIRSAFEKVEPELPRIATVAMLKGFKKVQQKAKEAARKKRFTLRG